MKNVNLDIQVSNRIISVIAQGKAQYEKMVDELENFYALVNENLEVIEANKNFRDISEVYYFRSSVFDYFDEASIESLKLSFIEVLETNKSVSIEVKSKDQKIILLIISIIQVKRVEEGKILKILGTDITELRKREGLISDIFRSVTLGLVMIGPDNTILGGFSDHSKIVLEHSELEGMNIFDVFFDQHLKKYSNEEKQGLEDLKNFLGKTRNDFTSIAIMAPKLVEIPSKVRMTGSRLLQVSFEPIAESGIVTRYLLILQDMSEFMSLNPLKPSDDLSVIHHLLESDPDTLEATFLDVNDLIGRVPKDFSGGISTELRENFHTIKGLFRLSGLNYLGGKVHALEDQVKEILSGADLTLDESWGSFLEDFSKVSKLYEYLINPPKSEDGQVEVPDDKSSLPLNLRKDFLERILKFSPSLKRNRLLLSAHLMSFPEMSSTSSLESSLKSLIENNKSQLKMDANYEFDLLSQSVSTENLKSLKSALIHLVNNSFAHGFQNLPHSPKITLKGDISKSFYTLNYFDNGQGINTVKIRQKLMSESPQNEAEINDMSEFDIAMNIFREGLSTKDEVSELAGRGVGLSGALSEILRTGGKFELVEFKKGCHFKISIPIISKKYFSPEVCSLDLIKLFIEARLEKKIEISFDRNKLVPIRYPSHFFSFMDQLASLDFKSIRFVDDINNVKNATLLHDLSQISKLNSILSYQIDDNLILVLSEKCFFREAKGILLFSNDQGHFQALKGAFEKLEADFNLNMINKKESPDFIYATESSDKEVLENLKLFIEEKLKNELLEEH